MGVSLIAEVLSSVLEEHRDGSHQHNSSPRVRNQVGPQNGPGAGRYDGGAGRRSRCRLAADHVANDLQRILCDSVWRRVCRLAEFSDVRLHDLRHSFASFGAAGNNSLLILGKLLGHRHAATTERYSHLSADPMRQAAEAIGQRIKTALAGETATNVVPVPPSRADA